MWNRKDLKANAREAFKANYWPCVLIPFIPVAVGMLLGLLMTVKMFSNVNELVDAAQSATDGDYLSYYFKIFGSMSSMISISSLLSIFVLNPLSVGIARFFLVNSYTPAEVGEVTDGFKGGKYLKSVGTLFLMGLAISAGLFLFYIPGFILMYSYRLVPFILASAYEGEQVEVIRPGSEFYRMADPFCFYVWFTVHLLDTSVYICN